MTWRNKQFQTSNRRELYIWMQLGRQLLHHPVALVHLEVLHYDQRRYSSTCGSKRAEDPFEQELDDEEPLYTLCDNVRPNLVLCP